MNPGDTQPLKPQPIPGGSSSSAIDLAPGVTIPKREIRFAFSRASGPGGQAVNKLSTRAELRVEISAIHGLDEAARDRLRRLAGQRLTASDEIIFTAQTHRSQLDNKQACLDRLCDLVARAARQPTVRKKKKPTRAMKENRLQGKRETAQRKAGRRWKPES
jgi:ribosome-associated protein